MSSVSVVIATLNRPALLLDAVASANDQVRPPLEIIIVDDGSQPAVDAVDLNKRFGPGIRVLRNDHAEGLAWARQQGVDAASGDYVVHLDDDDRFAPELVSACVSLLDAQPEVELVFIGVQGFGERASHFNRVHPEGTAKVILEAGGEMGTNGVVRFDRRLVQALLNRVPMPFQRVMARREVWQRVSRLRRESYRDALGLADEAAARDRIRGTLRDSEWAVYAAIACEHTALLNRPLYLQRCEGQGTSSQPAMSSKHQAQSLTIRETMDRAASRTRQLLPYRASIRSSHAQARFNAAYQNVFEGSRVQALMHLWRSFVLGPGWRHARLLVRILVGSKAAIVPNLARSD